MNIGLLGYGCVGQGVYELWQRHHRTDFNLRAIGVKDPTKPRPPTAVPIVTDPAVILTDGSIGAVVEAISDVAPSLAFARSALGAGKHVVSANKRMLAYHLPELQLLAQANGVSLRYEAAVGGAIPIVQTLERYFVADRVVALRGILNGTSNYVLTRVVNEGQPYGQALRRAQELGFAEADPTLDVGGYDPKFKLLLLSALVWGTWLHPDSVPNIGIATLSVADFEAARSLGAKIRLVAQATHTESQLSLSVLPQFVLPSDELYGVDEEFNALQVTTEGAGPFLLRGRGAGKLPTGLANWADLLAIRRGGAASPPLTLTPGTLPESYLRVYVRGSEALRTLLLAYTEAENDSFAVGTTTPGRILALQERLLAEGGFVAVLPEGRVPSAPARQRAVLQF
ncbi:MAG: homoserine dehydrogenase [Bacteroidia bacterium]|nr:homoserine dehydrogenase [Bacteroidia bacterium]